MTCSDKCIHYAVCEQKKYDFANIEECLYYSSSDSDSETASLNRIIESLIEWCVDNGYKVDIQIGTAFPSYAVFITLKKGEFKYTHEFYMAGGVFCIDCWRDFPREFEIDAFLKDAKEQFEKAQAESI